VYIPRVETEQWVILLGTLIHNTLTSSSSSPYTLSNPFRILDICSGSGCIPLLLAHLGQGLIHTIGVEVDDRALAVARENAKRNNIDHLSKFEKFDLFDDSEEGRMDYERRLGMGEGGRGFDMVVSNPPYVSSEDMKKVEKGQPPVGSSESHGDEDVTDGDDGYSFYRRIKQVYESFLDESTGQEIKVKLPKLVLEVGSTQSRPVQEMYTSEGRLEVQRETERRKEIGAPKLEDGDMVGTERSVWVYRK
jgi:release factor glutamine methyltransferase